MRLLATTQAPTPVPVANRFGALEVEDVALQEPTEPETPIAVGNCPVAERCHVSNVSVGNEPEHDLLRIQGKIGGRRAVMLIDSGSTHDFIADSFVRKHHLDTDASSAVLSVTLADGSTSEVPQISTRTLRVTVGGFSEEQHFTVYPLTRYDAILGKPWLTRNNPSINFRTNEVQLDGEPFVAKLPSANPPTADRPSVESMFISGRQARHALRSGAEGFLAWVTAANEENRSGPQLQESEQQDIQNLLKRYQDLFPDELPNELPPKRPVDHEIQIEDGARPPSRPAYRLPKPEMDELQSQLSELLEKGFIEPSKSPYGAPVFFVKKSDGTLRMVCDWRELNRITIKNKACLPNIDDLFDTIQGSAYFSKLDLRSGYNQIRIQDSDVSKTAINTPFGHFQFRVMGFGLTNAPATFQSLMNSILQPHLRKFVVVFLDDILVFSKTWEDHQHHLQTVLETLRNSELYCKQSKCEFGVREVLFLGHKINGTSISPDPKKISAVETWPTPSSVTDVRKFLGFANYFRRFIDRHSTISRPLEEITGKNSRFEWSAARQKAFESLKSALLEAPVLQLADVEKSFMVETDASDFAVAGVLLQQGEDMDLHPVAYCSRKLSAAERNYTAAERETLAVVFALKCWRIYLFRHFDLMTDNMGVVYLRTKPTLTKREARWVEFLADYDFTVFHKPGKKNIADPLSRRPDLFSDSEIGGSSYPPNIQLNAIEHTLEINPDLAQLIVSGYKCDKDLAPIIRRLKNSSHDNLHDRYLLNETPGYLYLRSSPQNRLCIPKSSKLRLALLQEYHDCVTAGHPGRDRTYFRLARYFYWPRMGLDVKAFVKSCDVCQRVKGGQLKTGLLQNLPVPSQPWADISMDFIMGLPRTDTGHDAIYVFVDRLTKCVHLAPTSSTIDAKGSADLYIQHVFRLHGLSSSIVCDRDPRFTAAFFQELFDRLGTKLAFSTANHPQTDGLTERVNRIVEDVLRAFVNHKQDNWDMLLPLCEFSINSATQSSTGNTPFFLNYGLNPRAPPDFLNPIQGGRDSADWLQARQDAVKISQDALVAAQARQAFYADRTRVEGKLKVGDLVMVYRDFLLTPEARDRPSHKLRPKWFGPFPITHVVGPNAYKLKLPHTSRCHPVFNVSALRAYEKNAIPNRRQPTPPPITDLDGHARYVVENILSHRRRQNQLQYLVKWQGYSDATWEPEHYLLDESGNDIVPLQKYKTLASAR